MVGTSRDRQQAKVVYKGESRQASRLQKIAQGAGAFYSTQLALATGRDPEIGAKIFDVINLSVLPIELIGDPLVLLRVIRARLLQRFSPMAVGSDAMADYPTAPTRG